MHQSVLNFGKAVRKIRKERQMTLEALALEIGLDAAHLSRIEHGKKDITLATASRLAKGLGFDLSLGPYKLTRSKF